MISGKHSISAFNQRHLIRGRKKAGTNRAKDACSEGIAAIAFPQSRACCQEFVNPCRPSELNPRLVCRARVVSFPFTVRNSALYLLDTIHGGAVGKRMN